jgi:hypothetical protein
VPNWVQTLSPSLPIRCNMKLQQGDSFPVKQRSTSFTLRENALPSVGSQNVGLRPAFWVALVVAAVSDILTGYQLRDYPSQICFLEIGRMESHGIPTRRH